MGLNVPRIKPKISSFIRAKGKRAGGDLVKTIPWEHVRFSPSLVLWWAFRELRIQT